MLGIGNILMNDDAAGVLVVQSLAENFSFAKELILLLGMPLRQS